jgi:hypothetical protein
MKTKCKPKFNQTAQDEVLSALWDFAAENSKVQPNAKRCSDGCQCNLAVVGMALDRIMTAFGYATVREP